VVNSNCVKPLPLSAEPPSNNPSSIRKACQIKPIPNNTDDKLNRILNELQSIKSQQIKSDELLNCISSSMAALNDKVVQQGKNISALGHSVNSFGKQLNTVTNDVKSQGQLIGGLETRILAAEKTLSNISASPSTTESTPSINDIGREVQLRTLLAVNLIVRGVPESPNTSISERITQDKKIVSDIFDKLNPPVPVESILRAFRIGKTATITENSTFLPGSS